MPFQHIHLPKRYARTLGERLTTPVPTPDGGWIVHCEHGPEVLRLDHQLNLVWRRDLQAQTEGYVSCRIAVSPDGTMMAIAGKDSVRITDAAGTLLHTFVHAAWDSFCGTECLFSPDSRYLWFVVPGPSGGDDLLHVMETASFSVVDRVSTQNNDCAYFFYPTPMVGTILMDTAAGQDGSTMYLVRSDSGRISLEELPQCQDQIIGNFSPAGDELVTAPVDEGPLRVYSFPEMAEIASMPQEMIGHTPGLAAAEEPDTFEYIVRYLTADLLVALTRFGRLLAIDRKKMQPLGELVPEGYGRQAYDEAGKMTTDPARTVSYGGDIIDFFSDQAGGLLVVHQGGALAVYDLSPLESGGIDQADDLNPQLLELLQRHGIEARRAGGGVQVLAQPDVFLDSRVQHRQQNGLFLSQLDVRLIAAGVQIVECFADVGQSLEKARSNNLENFARNSLHPLIAGFFDHPAADIDIEMWEIGSHTYRVYLGNYGVKSNVGAIDNIPTDLISRLESFIRQLDLHEAYHWVRWFVSAHNGALDTVEFMVDNQPLKAGEEMLRSVAWPQKEGFYSVRHFVLLKRNENAATAGGLTAAAPVMPAAKPKRSFWSWLRGSR